MILITPAKRADSLVLRSAARDPCLIAPLAALAVFKWLAPLAAMFAGKPKSSSDPTKRSVKNQL
jgi:hypothetical protein